MAELTDPASGKPLVLRVEITAEGGGSVSVPALEAGLRALADRPSPSTSAPDVEDLTRREGELERRQRAPVDAERPLPADGRDDRPRRVAQPRAAARRYRIEHSDALRDDLWTNTITGDNRDPEWHRLQDIRRLIEKDSAAPADTTT